MDLTQVYLEIYTKTYNRFGPYVIGLGFGYLLHKTRSCKVKLCPWYVILGWLLAIMAGFLVIFGSRGMYFDNHVYNRLEASFYAGFHRQVFVLSVSWIIFCCMHGYAGPINYLLSWRGWISLSKLTYCAYLSHYLFILSHVGAVRTTGNLTQMNVMRAFFANLMFTMIVSALWSLCFEMPFMTVDNILFSGRRQNSSKTPLKTYDFTASSKEIYQSKDSITYINDNPGDNPGCSITRYDLMKIAKKNGAESINDKAETRQENVDKIYCINPIRRDETSAVNFDNRRSDYVNVNVCRIFKYRRPKARSNEKESKSIDNDLAHKAKISPSEIKRSIGFNLV